MIPDQPAADAVKKIFELYTTGMYSFNDLAKYLNERGFTTCTGRSFCMETIRSMLEKVAYVGYVVYNNKAEEKVEFYQGKHEALVPLELFNRVKELRAKKALTQNMECAHDDRLKNYCLVQGLLCCSSCHQRLRTQHASGGKNSYRYMDCATSRGLKCVHDGKSIQTRKVDAQVINFLHNILLPENWVQMIERKVSKEDHTQKINAQIEIIKSRMQRRTFAFVGGNSAITEAIYNRDQVKDSEEIEELKRKLPKNSADLNTQITLTNSLITLFGHATNAERYEIVHYLFKNIYYDFESGRICGFEVNPDYEFLFSTLSEKMKWAKVGKIYYIEGNNNAPNS